MVKHEDIFVERDGAWTLLHDYVSSTITPLIVQKLEGRGERVRVTTAGKQLVMTGTGRTKFVDVERVERYVSEPAERQYTAVNYSPFEPHDLVPVPLTQEDYE